MLLYSLWILDNDHKQLIGGSVTAFNEVDKNYTAMIIVNAAKRTAGALKETSFPAQNAASVTIAPNPTKDNVCITITCDTAEKVIITLVNAEGKQLTATTSNIPAGYSKQLLPMAKYRAGIY